MLQRYVFVTVCVGMLSGLGVWSARIEMGRNQKNAQAGLVHLGKSHSLPQDAAAAMPFRSTAQQRELLETLEKVVSYQHYYRSVYGHFTKILSRTGVNIPKSIGTVYEIRVTEATAERLLITAFSEVDGKAMDQVSIDEDYSVKASFSLPPPRPEYLRLQAARYLRSLVDSPDGQVPAEKGVFKGHFKYEVRRDSENKKIAFAVGIRPPVLGTQMEVGGAAQATVAELDPQFVLNSELDELTQAGGRLTGQQVELKGGFKDEAYLAQKIFHGEIGRYAQSWSELSKIANFQFSDESQRTGSGAAPQREIASVESAPSPRNLTVKDVQGVGAGDLEIEPISTSFSH